MKSVISQKKGDGTYHFHGGCHDCKNKNLERCFDCCYMSVSVDWDLPSLNTENGVEGNWNGLKRKLRELEEKVETLEKRAEKKLDLSKSDKHVRINLSKLKRRLANYWGDVDGLFDMIEGGYFD